MAKYILIVVAALILAAGSITTALILTSPESRPGAVLANTPLWQGGAGPKGNKADPLPPANKLVGTWSVEGRVDGFPVPQAVGAGFFDAKGGYSFKGTAALGPTGPVQEFSETGRYDYDDVEQGKGLTVRTAEGTMRFSITWHGDDEFHLRAEESTLPLWSRHGVQVYKRMR